MFFQGERDRYQRAASDPMGRPFGLFLTYDMDDREAFIVLDLSWLREQDDVQFVNLMLFGAALATTSAGQSDPAWDFGRGGAEVQGQPACYMPAPSITERKMYNLGRPSCFPGHMQ